MPFLHSPDWCTPNLLLQHLLAVALTLVCPHSNRDSTMCFCPGNPDGRSPKAGTGLGKEGRGRGWWSVAEEARPAGGCTLGLEAMGLDWS